MPKNEIPIVPYLHLPDAVDGEAYLIGAKCRRCGEVYLGERAVCIKCFTAANLDAVKLSHKGEIFTFTVVYQSAPWVKVPYVAVVVKLSDGPVVRASLADCDIDATSLRAGMPVEMVTEKVREDQAGNDVIAYKFRLLGK